MQHRKTGRGRRSWLAGMAIGFLTLVGDIQPALATYPERMIKLVVPYVPGGSSDQFARTIAEGMSQQLGQTVVVENRPGGATMVGTSSVARSPADGYTVVLATNGSMVLNPMLYKKISYNALHDFKIFNIGLEVPLVVVTNNETPAGNLQEFAAIAKSRERSMNYASPGLGNALQLATEMLRVRLGFDIEHIPYNGSAPALLALLSNDVQLMVDIVSTALPHIVAGKLKALAVTGRERLDVLPDVPTVAESGYPNFQAATWFGLAVPAQTPSDAVDKLRAAADHVLMNPEFRAKFNRLGLVVQSPRTQDEINQYISEDTSHWGKVIRENHISLD